jgi:surface-anchored protein
MATLNTFATTEHVDLNITHSGGAWAVQPQLDGVPNSSENVLLYVGQKAELPRPAGANYNFLGVAQGADFYELPASQNSDVLYLGFAGYGVPTSIDRYSPATESKGRITSAGRWSKLTLADVKHYDASGNLSDGTFSVYEYGANVKVFMSNYNDGVSNPDGNGLDTTDGITADDALWALAASHNHYNFGFSKPGRYEVDVIASAYLTDDGVNTPNTGSFSQSTPIRLYFSVLNVGQIEFDAASYSVNEGAGTATINVHRTGGTDGQISAQYATTSGGTATAASDYTETSGTVTFLDQETVKTITIPIINDTLDEPNETVNLVLSNPGPASIADYVVNPLYDNRSLLGTQSTAVLTIVDNDDPANTAPTISDVANQSTSEDTPTSAIAFTVGDAETAAAALVVTATSSNTTLVPHANIVLGGSGANRTVTITPAGDQSGTTTITLTVIDGSGATATDTFVLTVGEANDTPTISDVANQSTAGNTPTGAIPFTIGDVETAAGDLIVTTTSSNTTLVPNANITLGGNGANRTVTLNPATGQSGTTTITLTVTDAGGLTATDTFVLTVGPINGAPMISAIADTFVLENAITGAIAFTIGDDVTPAGDLVVTATSSNTTIVPNANIVLGGSGENRTLTITPAANSIGSTTITITVTDSAGGQITETFELTVAANRTVPFAQPQYYGPLTASAFDSVAADFNGDNFPDLITAREETPLIYLGNGQGGFFEAQPLVAGLNARVGAMAEVDYDGDGDLDVVAQEFYNDLAGVQLGAISVYRNSGTGQFSRVLLKDGLEVGFSIDAGDLNGDGRADVTWATQLYDSTTRTYTNSFNSALQLANGELGATTVLSNDARGTVMMGDVNSDGKLDIVTAGTIGVSPAPVSYRVQIHLGNGDGTFAAPQSFVSGSAPALQAIVDLNGDSRPDILLKDTTSSPTIRVGYYPQQADGSFGARVPLMSGITQLNVLAVADINQDGISDLVASVVRGNFRIEWFPGFGNGQYGNPVLIGASGNGYGMHVLDLDQDSRPDIIAVGTTPSSTSAEVQPVYVFINKTGEDPMVLLPPAARTRVAGDPIELQVYFGFPITVTGTPRIALQVGSNTVYADYVSGSGTPTLTFRYTVAATDLDLDGVQLASNTIDLNNGTLTDPVGDPASLQFPSEVFNGVFVNGRGPLVQMISRLDATPTTANQVRFAVQFAEDVTGVDIADFSVRMTEGDLAGASIVSVTGSGSLYEVTVSTGTGSGALGLSVNDSASILDMSGDVLAKGYTGGQVYTVRQQPVGDIDVYYTNGHADYRPLYNNGEFDYVVHGDPGVFLGGELPSDEVITYADSNAIISRPTGTAYDFLGVAEGAPLYVLPSSNNPSLPYLGFSGESFVADVFADYRPSDPRITSATLREYVKVQMVGMRSSSGGEFSLYSVSSGNPTVWMATNDDISESDNIWLYPGTHLHRNTAFSRPGTYEIDVVVSGYLDSNGNHAFDPGVDTYVESGIQTMVFHVDTLGAVDDSFVVNPQGTLTGSVTANDDWNDGIGGYVAGVEVQPTQGTLTLQTNGSFTYVPGRGFDGTDSFVYRLTNERGGYTTATVELKVNHSPIANDDAYSVDEDGTLTVEGSGVLGNDSDPDGDSLVSTVVAGPQNGMVTLNPDGSFTYVPNPNFSGTDTFTYTTTDVRYEIIPLGTLGGNTSSALDVNNLGQVTGNSLVVSDPGSTGSLLRAYLWTDGTMTNLGSLVPIPPSTSTNRFARGYAVNDAGVVVGEFNNDGSRAFVYINGTMMGLTRLAGDNDNGVASDINNSNVIVGSSSNGTASRPTIWTFNGTTYVAANLGTIRGTPTSTGRAWAINEAGDIVGSSHNEDGTSQATLWDGSTIVNLGSLGNGLQFSQAYGLNEQGLIVGSSSTGQTVGQLIGTTSSTGITRAFVWHDGHMHELLPANFYAAGNTGTTTNYHSVAMDVNDTGLIVGNSQRIASSPARATLWFEESVLDLNSLIPAATGWTLLSAEGINDNGEIVGYGSFGGVNQAFMLRPVVAGNGGSLFGNTATVTITVNGSPDAPVAANDAYVVGEGSVVRGNVLFNDLDPDGEAITAAIATQPAAGSVTLNANGSFVYTPNASFAGTDSFTYTIQDTTGATSTATVTISAAGAQDFEVILSEGHADIGLFIGTGEEEIDHGDHSHTVEGEPAWDLHVHDGENDEEYETDRAMFFVGPQAQTTRSNGLETAAYDFLGVAPGESFYVLPAVENPELLFLGFGTEEIEAGALVGGTARINLKSVNGPGQLSLWQFTSGAPHVAFATSDGVTSADTFTVLEGGHTHYNWGFSLPGRYEVTIEAVGTVVGHDEPTTATTTYYFSVDSLGRIQLSEESYSVDEGGNVTLTIERVGGSDGPLTIDYSTGGGTATAGSDFAALVGSLMFADGETSKTIILTSLPDSTVEGPETTVVSLAAGTDSPVAFGSPSSATVTIIDGSPIANPQSVSLDEDGSLPITLTGSDPQETPLTYTVVTGPANGSLTGTGATRVYTPNANFFGTDSFTFQVNDGEHDSEIVTVQITVVAVNDAPTLATIANPAPIAPSSGLQTIALTGISAGPNESQSLTVAAVSSNPGLIPNPTVNYSSGSTGSLTFTPVAGQSGTATITVTLTDDGGTANGGVNVTTRTFTITVQNPATLDFGDAPDSYGTLLASNGPRHTAGPLFLGSSVTAEADAVLAGDVDNGVAIPSTVIAGMTTSYTVTASQAGKLDAWIDFNRNGTFDANEKIANSVDVVAGTNTLRFNTPLNASGGESFARFRLSTTGGLSPLGAAADGEVEDYSIRVVSVNSPGAVVVPDPEDASRGLLVVNGTSGSDYIRLVTTPGTRGRTIVMSPTTGTYLIVSNASFDKTLIRGGAGADMIMLGTTFSKPATIYGDAGNDTIIGGSGNDRIHGGAGIDVIYGGAGDDQIFGEADIDFLYGETGNDLLNGGDGLDYLYGGSGADLLIGGNGSDYLFGEGGDDLIVGGKWKYDADPTALAAMQLLWGSASPFNTRVSNLQSRLNSSSLSDDGSLDFIWAGNGRDWVHDSALQDLVLDFNNHATSGDKRN